MKTYPPRYIQLITVIALTFILFSCSLGIDETASISFTLPDRIFSDARNVTISGDSGSDGNFHVLSVIRGDKTFTQYDTITASSIEQRKLSLKYDSIRVGTELSIEVNIFSPLGEWLYEGTTSSFKVRAGTNELSLKLFHLNNDASFNSYACYLNYGEAWVNGEVGAGYILLDENGIYELVTDSFAISKGKWSGSIENGSTIYLTEYLYAPVLEPDWTESPVIASTSDDTVIATNLKEYRVNIDEDMNFTFTLQNGISVNGAFSN